jgi:hypothetical protein
LRLGQEWWSYTSTPVYNIMTWCLINEGQGQLYVVLLKEVFFITHSGDEYYKATWEPITYFQLNWPTGRSPVGICYKTPFFCQSSSLPIISWEVWKLLTAKCTLFYTIMGWLPIL